MDVELSDGTVIADVPQGTSKEQLLQKLYQANHPAWKTLSMEMAKERPWGSGAPAAAYEAGGKVTDLATKAGLSPELAGGAGYVTNVAMQALPALLTGARDTGPSLLKWPAKRMMQSAAKPLVGQLERGQAGRAINTMLAEDISPTMGGMSKAQQIARALNNQVEQAISQSSAQVNVPRSVTGPLSEVLQRARMQPNNTADVQAVIDAGREFMSGPSSIVNRRISIPVQIAQALKKGTYANLGSKAYGELKSTSVEAQKAIARGLREGVANAVPEVVEPLKRESELMNVLDVAQRRALMESNKNPMGLAALRFDDPRSLGAFLADRSGALKALMARLLYRGSQPGALTAENIAAMQAVPQITDVPQ